MTRLPDRRAALFNSLSYSASIVHHGGMTMLTACAVRDPIAKATAPRAPAHLRTRAPAHTRMRGGATFVTFQLRGH